MKYKKSILGGTFDHLHVGHKHFISSAFEKSEHVTIGLTIDEFSKDKEFSYSIQNYEVRRQNLLDYLSSEKLLDRSEIISIDNPYGTALDDSDIDAIFVTDHGLSNAKLINEKRKETGLTELEINVVPFLTGDDGNIISSTRIRSGEINRDGFSYISLFKKDLVLPSNMRGKVNPEGELVSVVSTQSPYVISVGDVVSEDLLKQGKQSDFSIVDLKTKRKEKENEEFKYDETVINDAGTISAEAVLMINKLIRSEEKNVLKVMGEEDLLALPAIMLAPLSSIIVYGLPDKGAVVARVSEESKEEVGKMLSNFS